MTIDAGPKSKKPKSKKRERGRRSGRSAGAGGPPRRTDQPTPEEFEFVLDRLVADVDQLHRQARPAPDIDRLRVELAGDGPGVAVSKQGFRTERRPT